MNAQIPNFSSLRALVLHRSDSNCVALCEQLRRLKIGVTVQWPPAYAADFRFDLVFFDVDHGFDGMFPWAAGDAPVPLIAIVGSETPGRLEWAMNQHPSTHILKPIGSNGVFHMLFTAFHSHAAAARMRQRVSDLNYRLKCRPIVVRAIMNVMLHHGIGDDDAFRLLRTASMRRQISIEDISQKLLDGFQFDQHDLEMHSSTRHRKGTLSAQTTK